MRFPLEGWGGDQGLHLVALKHVCSPKQYGGLGIRRMGLMNKALIRKWLWRFGVERDSLWRQVVAYRHGIQENGDPYPSRGPIGSCPWKGIMRFFSVFQEGLRIKIGNG